MSYYGIPPIRKPHWKWLIVSYFFLGSLAAGSYAVASIAELVGGEDGERIARVGRYLSFAALIPSPVLLILDLGRPERFHHMLRVVKLRSPMSAGVWGLLGFSGFCGLSALIQAARDGVLAASGAPAHALATLPSRAVGVLGLGPAAFVGGYTGVLLAATAVPLWTRGYLLMGPLFLTSAVSNGTSAIVLALALLPGASRAHIERLERLHRIAVLAELGLLALLRARLEPVLARPLARGRLGSLFRGGVVGLGLVAPLLIQALAIKRRAPSWSAPLASGLVLLGGFLLRYTFVMAGHASADDPEATFMVTA